MCVWVCVCVCVYMHMLFCSPRHHACTPTNLLPPRPPACRLQVRTMLQQQGNVSGEVGQVLAAAAEFVGLLRAAQDSRQVCGQACIYVVPHVVSSRLVGL